ncbi:MAG: AI-2E family transporter [Eggerthellaceae bacterium]|nr:AI-2E family transporter [Eggerthellaceae bacterium]
MQGNTEIETKEGRARYRLTIVWMWVGIIVLCGVGVFLSGVLSNAIGIVIWAVVFVFLLRGPVNWLDAHGVNRTVGTVIAYIMLIALIALLIFAIFSPVVGIGAQFEELLKSLPSYIQAFQDWATNLYGQYADILQSDTVRQWVSDASAQIGSFVQSFASTTASGLVAAGGAVANIALVVGFALVIAFWMLIELPNLGREVNRLIGEERRADANMIHLTVTRVMGGYLKATIIQCAIIGVACGILFWILGVPSPAALAVITGLLNIIPIIGPWLGGALAFVASVITSPVVGIAALIGTIVIQQVIYTFVSPKLMGDSVDIHPAITFIALTAGAGIGGAMGGLIGSLVGALLSIPLVAMAKSFFVYYFEKKTGRQIVAEDGVFFRGTPSAEGEVDPVVDATAPASAEPPSVTGRIRGLTGKIPKIDDPDDR